MDPGAAYFAQLPRLSQLMENDSMVGCYNNAQLMAHEHASC